MRGSASGEFESLEDWGGTAAVPATVEPVGEGRVKVVFEAPVSAITPGQVVTVYENDMVLGGGWIDRTIDLF